MANSYNTTISAVCIRIKVNVTEVLSCSHAHVGVFELHVPSDWQVMVLDPANENPLLHVNVTVVPTGY